MAIHASSSKKNWSKTSVRILAARIVRFWVLVVFLCSLVGMNPTSVEAATVITFTAEELLGKPTDSSVTINIVPDTTIEYHYQYGTSPGSYTAQTSNVTATAGQPHEVTIDGLAADTQYSYRMRYHLPGEPDWVERSEHTFHTQRASGEEFIFAVTSDSHATFNTAYQNAMVNVLNEQPDFLIDLGDTFYPGNVASQSAVNDAYLAHRNPLYMDRIGHSVPIFLSSGNHEEEEGWNLNDTPFSIGVASIQARKAYFPTPIDDGFYSGNTDPLAAIDETIYGDELREDYYAWEWGDALFVVIDEFQYTMNLSYTPAAGEGSDDAVTGDQWSWTLGEQQYNWLKDTLENSDARYKFVFSHHMTGGITRPIVSVGAGYVRGGAEAARYFEWGGYNADGTWGFTTQRPGWDAPIHQLFVDNGVSAYFHGHDHQYVYETRDGVVYQEVPSPSMSGAGFSGIYTEGSTSEYNTVEIQPNSGHLRISVAQSQATVNYVSSSSTAGTVNYSYTILPNDAPSYTITATAGANGTITPSGAVSVTAGSNQSFAIAPASGYQVADVLVDGATVGAVTSYTFTNVQADHTIAASFAELPASPLAVDGAVSTGTAASGSSLSITHTTGTGANRLMLVGVSWNAGSTAQTISSVTFTPGGGSAVTLTPVRTEQTGTQYRYSAIYSLVNPPSGQSGTVAITFSGSVANGIVGGVVNFTGVDQTTPLGTARGANGQSTAPSLEVTGLAGNELVFENVFQGASSSSQTLTAGAGQNQLWNGFVGNVRAAASTEQAVSSSVTLNWTAASSSYWAIAAVPVRPAAAGPTHQLTLAVTPAGSGTTSPAAGAAHTYPENAVVNITATPGTGYAFDYWEGTVASPSAASTTVTMDADKTVTAHFRAAAVPITFTGTELLGRPTDTSIAISVVPDANITLYYEYGTTAGVYTNVTPSVSAAGGQPQVVTISGLSPNTRYFYRMQYSADGGSTWTTRSEHSFQTQRSAGSAFTFAITSDSHVDIQLGNEANWTSTLNRIAAETPDFLIDLGDTFAMDNGSTSVPLGDIAAAEQRYKDQLPFFNIASASSSIYTVAGNHEQQEAWHLQGTLANSLPVMSKNAEKKFFLNPVNDAFYSGDPGTYSYLSSDQLKQDYYSWTWGDALFVVISPFWTTTTKPYTTSAGGGETDATGTGDRWDWTLGQDQFNWLRSTLEGSSARYKFVFSHQIVGGNGITTPVNQVNYGHGGVDSANLVEWGGYNIDGTTWAWDTERPGWGSQPIRQMMEANGVTAFFHGHDHQFAHESLNGMVYQSVPSGSFTGSFGSYTTGANSGNTIWADSTQGAGYLKVTVDPAQTTVDFIRYNGTTPAYTYTMAPTGGPSHTLTVSVDPVGAGSTTPAVGAHTYVEGSSVTVTAAPASGYQFDHWSGACSGPGACQVVMNTDQAVTAHFTAAPVSAITYVGDIGSAVSKTSGASLTVNTTAAVAAGDDIIIVYATDPAQSLSPVTVSDSAGNTYTEVGYAVNTQQLRTYILAAYNVNALPAGSSITITASASVTARAAVVSVFNGLADSEVLDQVSTGENDASATASSGATPVTTQADELLVGGIGTEGPSGDTAGTWQNMFTTGPRTGTTGGTADTNITAALGWRIVTETGAYTASKTGMTTRDHASIIATFKAAPSGPVPQITIAGTPLAAFNSLPGTPSAEQSYAVSGSGLDGDIVITAPTDFQISLTSGGGFGSLLTLPQVGGSVAETTVYVRFNRATAGTSSGNITHTSSGAITRNVAVSGVAAAPEFDVLLGRPTDHSITINVIPDQAVDVYFEYGNAPGSYTQQTTAHTVAAGTPLETVMDGLAANTRYYYRIVSRPAGGSTWGESEEYSFITQRTTGSTFTFTVISDSHLGQYGGQTADELALYEQTLTNVGADQPDFHIDLGDSSAMDPSPLGTGMTEAEADAAWLIQRPYLDQIGRSTPVYLALGNHENEEGWNFDDTFTAPDQSLARVGMKYRKLYFPNPVPDDFYTGNTDPLSEAIGGDTNREDYYAWEWGDALFVVLDPYHYSMTWPAEGGTYGGEGQDGEVSGDRWDWTLGIQQYLWLKETLENSDATYKFVLSHHVTGGSTPYGRGGIEAAPYFEWGGRNADGTWGWDTERPAADGWDVPIHQLFVENGVDAYIHGHDHIFAYEELDGIAYLECPKPDDAGYTWEPYGYGYTENLYPNGLAIENSGHIRVTVSPTGATFEYVRSYLPGDGTNGQIAHSFTILPDTTETFTLTYTAGTGGTLTGDTSQEVDYGANGTPVTAVPNTGYHFVNWSDGSTANPRTDTNVTADLSVTATFAEDLPDEYNITATAGANGSIAPSGAVTVTQGADQVFTITPGAGYHVADVLVDGVSVGAVLTYTFNDVAADHTIAASFAINTFTLTYTAGTGGTLTGSASQVVNYGASGTPVTAVPNIGYHFVNWSDGSTANPRTDTNVTANVSVTANFAINTFTLTYTAGTGGTLTGSASQVVNYGASGTPITAVPNTGYHFVNWSDGSTANPRTDTNVTANLSVTANFAEDLPDEYTITATAGANGSITPSGAVTVTEGADQTFTITPATGYHVADVLVDGVSVGAVLTYTFNDVVTDHTIAASFAINTYTLTYAAGPGGTLTGTTSQVVNYGASGTPVTAVPNTGYHFVNWSDGSTANPRTDANVTANLSVTANFAVNTFTLTYAAGTGGTLTGSASQVVNYGEDGTPVTAVPNTGYHFVNWSDGSTANPRTDANVTANVSVTANFAINTFTLTYVAGAGGMLTGSASQVVNYGASGTPVTAVPNTGYHFVNWSDGSTANPRTDTNVTANVSVTANFAINTYTLTYTAGTGGTLTGTTSQVVNYGASGTPVTAVPNTGYHFVNWSDGSTANPRTDTNVTANLSVTATFAINTFTITATAGSNGSITPSGAVPVSYGADQAFTITPAAGYHVADVLVDGVSVGAVLTYTFNDVAADHTIAASFAINTFTLTYAAGTGGTLTGATSQAVNYGANGTPVTAVPNTGYHFVNWSDGSTANPRTDANVTANVSVTANFAINTFTLTYVAGAGGMLTGSASQVVNYGASGTPVTAVPSTGYHFVNWSDGSTVNPRTDANVTANLSVTANFAINTYTLTYTAGLGGTLTGETPQVVDYGASGTPVTAVPDTGYHFVNWSDGSTANPRTDTNITADLSVTASFAENLPTEYTITATAGANGSITPSGAVTVTQGADQSFTITPATGYRIADVVVDGVSVGAVSSYTFDNVQANHTIAASFEDATPPDTSITASPSNPSSSSTAVFSFSGTDNVTPSSGLTFECSLDGGVWSTCTSSMIYVGLANGSHTFSVRARDAAGNLDATPASYTWTIAISANQPPVANAGGPYYGNEGSTISLSASRSTDPDGNITLYEWDLDNDGLFDDATGRNPRYAFADNGVYTIRVRVTDAVGLSSTANGTVTVRNVSPSITSLSLSTFVRVGTAVNVRVGFRDPGVNDTFTVSWNWGDGTSSSGTISGKTAIGSHSYTRSGIYIIRITIRDDDGGTLNLYGIAIVRR